MKPEYAKFHVNFGNLLRLQGRWDEAIRCYEAAIQWDPRYAEAHYYLGCTLALQTKNAQAAGPLAAALELAPNFAAAANDLAWILATETNSAIRDVEKAVRLAERACELTAGSVPIYLDTLGVAYSEAGRFAEAIQATERAVARALAAGNTNLATPLQSRLEHFRAGRAWTEGRRQNVE